MSSRCVTTVWLAHWTCSIRRLARANKTPSATTVIGVSALTIKVTICTLFHDAPMSRHFRLAWLLLAACQRGRSPP
jgi:hypothetical protein